MGHANTTFYVKNNLCPSFKDLAFNCRKLKKSGLISDTWCANGNIKIKFSDTNIETISHEYDLYEFFPDFQDFSFDTSRYIGSNFESSDDEA